MPTPSAVSMAVRRLDDVLLEKTKLQYSIISLRNYLLSSVMVTVTALIAWGRGHKWDRVNLNEFNVILNHFDTFLVMLTLFYIFACPKFQERVFFNKQTKTPSKGLKKSF